MVEPKNPRAARVLVVDDDDTMRGLIARVLEREGLQTTLAPDGDAALEAAGTQRFDLIVTDIHMPGKDGLELLMELRRRAENVPVIAVSGGAGRGFMSYLPAAEHFGARTTLTTPLDFGTFLDAVRDALKNPRGAPHRFNDSPSALP
ncbi:MAG: response regulator [Deltaproteobacteria bacterium]|nr:response regulator [Deltaproteobacteria bacterium]